MRNEWKTSLKKESIVLNIATLTSLIHQCVITWRPNAFDRSHTQCPIKIISQGTLPATEPILKGAGCPTILFISTITTVVYEVTGLPQSVAPAIITRQRVWRTGACREKRYTITVIENLCDCLTTSVCQSLKVIKVVPLSENFWRCVMCVIFSIQNKWLKYCQRYDTL